MGARCDHGEDKQFKRLTSVIQVGPLNRIGDSSFHVDRASKNVKPKLITRDVTWKDAGTVVSSAQVQSVRVFAPRALVEQMNIAQAIRYGVLAA